MDQGRIDEAMVQYRQALKIKPDYARVYYNLGAVLAGRGQFDEAIKENLRVLAMLPGQTDIRMNLALAYYKKGDYLKAVESLKAAQSEDCVWWGRRCVRALTLHPLKTC